MGLCKTEAFVVQAVPFQEQDKRVILITRDFGRMTAIAPGAQKSRKRFGGGLETLTLIEALYFEKRNSSLVRLQEVNILNVYAPLKKSVEKIAYGSYFLELVSELMGEQASFHALFGMLRSFLTALEKTRHEELLSRLFEARLLASAGWCPSLRACVRCQASLFDVSFEPSQPVRFSFSAGGIVCHRCGPATQEHFFKDKTWISRDALVYLDQMISNQKKIKVDLKLAKELKAFLPAFLFYHLGREPRSYAFIQRVVVG